MGESDPAPRHELAKAAPDDAFGATTGVAEVAFEGPPQPVSKPVDPNIRPAGLQGTPQHALPPTGPPPPATPTLGNKPVTGEYFDQRGTAKVKVVSGSSGGGGAGHSTAGKAVGGGQHGHFARRF